MNTHTMFRAVLTATVALFVLFSASVSTAAVVLNSPDLPPESDPPNCNRLLSQYEGIDLHALYPSGQELSEVIYKCFTSVVRVTDPGTGDETELFNATVTGFFDSGTSPQMVVLTGPIEVVVRGKNNSESGSWDTEIISMNLTGDVGGIPIEIRESPALQSLGHTTVEEIGVGKWEIDSFFDVYTEISVAGGPFQPQTNPAGRITLVPIPPTPVILNSPDLPPESDPPDCDRLLSQYEGPGVQALYPSGIDFSDTIYKCFENVQITVDPGTGDETAIFYATVEGTFDDGSGPQPVVLTGPVTTVVRGKGGATTGSWDTEILSMNLTGDVGGIPIEIRESPSLPSVGQTTVTAIGGGRWQIDSFFDVYTELSIAGGPFQPQTNPAGRMTLMPIPPTVILSSPDLPAESDPPNCITLVSRYEGSGVQSSYPGGQNLSDPYYKCFINVLRTTDPGTGDETETFDATMEGIFDDGSGPKPIVMTGPVSTVARGKGGATTGSWDTEILSMSLVGDVGGIQIEIRESPSLPSVGSIRVRDIGGSLWEIDSFFDVFTELSVSGGAFQPQTNAAGRMDLVPIPPTVILNSPNLPPESNPPDCGMLASQYECAGVQALYPGPVDLSDTIYKCFKNVLRTTDPGTGDETETFDATVEGTFDDGSGPQPITMAGPVTTVARGKGGAATGSWDTEILSMSLTGDVGGIPIEIRESPSLRSVGGIRVRDIGGGLFEFDSSHYMYTELSTNGGSFQPQTNSAGRITLVPLDADGDLVPDPFDNCPAVWNPSQTDTDGDGVGDACDVLPGCNDMANLFLDNTINLLDFGVHAAGFGCTSSCTGDVDGDGDSDLEDARIIGVNWLCTGP